MPEPDCFLRCRICAAKQNFTSGKSDVYVLAAAATRGFKMVLRPTAAATHGFTMVLFTEPLSRRNTFVGGTCAPPSDLLVLYLYCYDVCSFEIMLVWQQLSGKPLSYRHSLTELSYQGRVQQLTGRIGRTTAMA